MSDSTSYDRDEALARLADEIAGDLAAGATVDARALAARHHVEEGDVRRCVAALDALRASLDEDLPEAPSLPAEYELLGEIGRGGMGIVYRVKQRSLDRTVALKLLRPGEQAFAEAVRRFEKEARALARLRHRHIVAIHEVGRTGGNLFYTMDLIEGSSLAELIREGQVPYTRAVRLLRQVAGAIAHAHAHGLIHRDLKPANILVDAAGDAFVVDFGLARDLGLKADATASGWILGTPAYMSPEQARGDSARIGEATDIYALGAVLYECLAGRPPFAEPSIAELIRAVVHDDPVPPRSIAPGVPRDLEIICLKALAKDPARRYPTVRAMMEDLERFEEGKTIRARPPSLGYRLSRFARRRASTLLTALSTAVFVAAAVVLFRPAATSTRETAASLHEAGEHGAARILLERELERQPDLLGPWADCALESVRELGRAGRWKEALALCDGALRRPTLPQRGDFLWERACAIQRTGTPEQVSEAFKGLHEALEKAVEAVDRDWPVVPTSKETALIGLLERMLPALSDPADPGHPTAAVFLAECVSDPFLDTDIRRWLEGLDARVVPLLPAILSEFSMEKDGRWDFALQALSDLAAAWSGPELERGLAAAAERPGAARDLLLSFLAAVADLPLRLKNPLYKFDHDSEPGAAEKILPMWKEWRDLSRVERRARGLRYAAEAVGDKEWLAAWVKQREARVPDVAPADLLRDYLVAEEGRRLALHHQLRLLLSEATRVPSLGIYPSEPNALPMAWIRVVHPDGGPASHVLRTCQLRIRDGNPEPLVAWSEARPVRIGEDVEFTHDIPVPPGPPSAAVGWTIPGLGASASPAIPNYQRTGTSARVEWHVDGLRVRWGGARSLRVLGGSTVRTSGGGDLVPARTVSSPDAAGGGSSSTGDEHHFEDVLTLGVVEPAGGEVRPWTLAEWRARIKADLAGLAKVLEAEVGVEPKRRRAYYRVHNELWKLLRAAWKLPMPESREELARIGVAYEKLGEGDRADEAWVARVHAGDPTALGRMPKDVEELRPDFWVRTALVATDVAVRDVALERLKDADFRGRTEDTLDAAIRGGRLKAPEALAERVRNAEARRAREHHLELLKRSALFLGIGVLLAAAGIVHVVRAFRGNAPRAASGLLGVGLALGAFYVRIDGRDWLADWAGYALAAAGAAILAREAGTARSWISPIALALAAAADLAGWARAGAALAGLGVLGLPFLAAALRGAPGRVQRILRAGFFVFYGGFLAVLYGSWLLGRASGLDTSFRLQGSTAATLLLVLTACLIWVVLHVRGAVRAAAAGR